MPADYGQHSLPGERVCQLSAAIANIADEHAGLAQRREAMLAALMEMVHAQAGVWAWGRGWPQASGVVPVAVIALGFSQQQHAAFMRMALDPETDRSFRQAVLQQMGANRAATTLWQDVFTAQQWAEPPRLRRQLQEGGWGCWLHSVCYTDQDTWSNLCLLRNIGLGDFSPEDAALAHAALNGVPWLRTSAEEHLPAAAFEGLSPRQRMVMQALLEGQPRKAIARRLQITEDTVGDHVKAVYAHFDVSSAAELASLFLRGR